MKRFLVLASAIVLAISMSIVSFAAYEWDSRHDGAYWYKGDDLYIGVIKTSELSQEQKDFLLEYIDLDSSSSGRTSLCLEYFNVNQPPQLVFKIFDSVPALDGTGSYTASPKTLGLNFKSPIGYRRLRFGWDGEFWRKSSVGDGVDYTATAYRNQAVCFVGGSFPYLDVVSVGGAVYKMTDFTFGHAGNTWWVDDDGLLYEEPEEPEEPEGPGNPNVIDMDYVPYDVSVWDKFVSSVRGSIGSSINIGLVAFAYILAVLIVIRVVNMFLGRK